MVQKFTPKGKRVVVTRIKTEPEAKLEEIFTVGDTVKVRGRAKGRGFTGVIKRWGFKGGPRTHGQSDRERAPGSIGQGTTPGRVFPGKKMPGRYGGHKVTVSGLKVHAIEVENQLLLVRGLVPGSKKKPLIITKVEKKKKNG